MTNRPSMLNSSTVVKFRNILLGWYSSTLRSPMWINREDMSHSSLQSADSRTGFKTVSKNWLYKLHYFAALISLKHIATAVTRWSLKPLTRKLKIEMECNLREKCYNILKKVRKFAKKIKTISKKNYQPIPWAHLCRLLEQPRSERKDGLKIKL